MSSTSSSVLTLSSFNLLFFTQVLTVLSSTIKYNEYATDKGGNVSIPCIAQGNIMWVKEHGNNSTIFQTGRVLVLRNVSTSDAGIYVCFASVPRPSTTTTTTTTRATTTTSATTSNLATSATTSSPNQQQQESEKQDEDDVEVRESPRDSQQESETEEEEVEVEYQAQQRTRLIVRTVPGPVSQLYFKASTILGFLIWRFNKTQSGGYPVRSFTAEYRNVSYKTPPANASFEHAWSRMDPINIAFNVRQMEVYRLAPNTTYEFRIWANNELGSGEVVTTNVTTLPETKEEELQDGWDSIELIPNIILNPGFSESDGGPGGDGEGQAGGAGTGGDGEDEDEEDVAMPFPRTIIFGQHHRTPPPPRLHLPPQQHHLHPFGHHSNQSHHHQYHHQQHHRRQDEDDDDDYEEEHEPTMERFKRKVSVFFTGPTIKRI
ncbi:contactin-2 isoform X3 [Drosophila ficusphila]|uniref:contactin-2 isoform X3 n=1 Tax=Drosophila ficusphila TaxID=30025 RepID=UPI0007E84436|nr:contactin-2 isoform X3 [Drosophila ficusphila]